MDAAAALREAILEKLRSRVWRGGHRLPPERALGTQFGVSRTTVRRVLQELKTRNLITQTVGSGTYVAADALGAWTLGPEARAADAALSVSLSVSPAELMSARMVLEPAIVEMVVGNATEADFARMDECIVGAEAAKTLAGFETWDAQLHQAIAEAAHNGFVVRIMQLVDEVRSQAEWGVLKRRRVTPERRRAYQREHRELVAALRQRDADGARAVCLAHLRHVRDDMLRC
jgi:DNA-binding FadR family transcriptional regulator